MWLNRQGPSRLAKNKMMKLLFKDEPEATSQSQNITKCKYWFAESLVLSFKLYFDWAIQDSVERVIVTSQPLGFYNHGYYPQDEPELPSQGG